MNRPVGEYKTCYWLFPTVRAFSVIQTRMTFLCGAWQLPMPVSRQEPGSELRAGV